MQSSTNRTETATLGGGCFWCLDAVYRRLRGVTSVVSGYAGGTSPSPSYEAVCSGRTGHAEVLRVRFDTDRISLREVLEIFFVVHDPTTLNQQHNDIGTQYRSAIFYTSEEQKAVAERVKAQVNKSGKWGAPIVTEITKASEFYPAEDYHQKYLVKNPGGYNCHVLRN